MCKYCYCRENNIEYDDTPKKKNKKKNKNKTANANNLDLSQ